ncbi:MAG: hypothetical protein AAB505_00995 [Patescibacteria group bacterium]
MENSEVKKTTNNVVDLGLSILPELSGLLTPDLVTDPVSVTVKVLSKIVENKLINFYSEWRERKKDQRTKDDLESIHVDSLADTLTFIQGNPDEERFNAVKKLFFKLIEPNTNNAEQLAVFELMQICKKLTSNDILVLVGAFEIFEKKNLPGNFALGLNLNSRHRNIWFASIAQKLGHNINSLVEFSEPHLIELKLISPIEERSPLLYFPEEKFRLTDSGFKLCQILAA